MGRSCFLGRGAMSGEAFQTVPPYSGSQLSYFFLAGLVWSFWVNSSAVIVVLKTNRLLMPAGRHSFAPQKVSTLSSCPE